MYQHLPKCKHCNDIVKLIKLRDRSRKKRVHTKCSFINSCVVNSCSSRSQLLFLEAFYIKMLAHKINDGLKASRELFLFK